MFLNKSKSILVLTFFVVFFLQAKTSLADSVSGTTILNISYNSIAWLDAHDQSTVNILDGGNVSYLDTYNASISNVYSGGTISWLTPTDQSMANVYGGDISWLRLYGQSTANIYGGTLSWLIADEQSTAHIYGSNFSYYGGILSGVLADGSSLHIWALATLSSDPSSITNTLPTNIVLHTVPLPLPIVLFSSGLAFLGFIGRRLQSGRQM